MIQGVENSILRVYPVQNQYRVFSGSERLFFWERGDRSQYFFSYRSDLFLQSEKNINPISLEKEKKYSFSENEYITYLITWGKNWWKIIPFFEEKEIEGIKDDRKKSIVFFVQDIFNIQNKYWFYIFIGGGLLFLFAPSFFKQKKSLRFLDLKNQIKEVFKVETKNSIFIDFETITAKFLFSGSTQSVQKTMGRELLSILKSIRACHIQALRHHPRLRGEIHLFFFVDPKGKIEKVELEKAEIADEGLVACAVSEFRLFQFSSPLPIEKKIECRMFF